MSEACDHQPRGRGGLPRGRGKHARQASERYAPLGLRPVPSRRRGGGGAHRAPPRAGPVIRARPVARLVELRLLVWVALLSVTGYGAVVAAASGRFAWYEVVVPVLVLAGFGALRAVLVAIGFRGDQLLPP